MNRFKSLIEILNHPLNRKQPLKALLRIVWWKFNQLFFHLPAVVQLTAETKCFAYPESSYGGLVIYTRWPEYPEMKFLSDFLESHHIFFDVGANMGVFSLIAASKIETGKIYAFEPSLQALEYLYQNIKLNHLQEKVDVVEKVVSDQTGREEFILGKFSETDHIAYPKSLTKQVDGKKMSLSSITLDSFASQRKLDWIDVAKIDVEGAELKVLKGFQRYLNQSKVGLLLIEINKKSQLFGSSAKELFSFLKRKKYDIYFFNQENRLRRLRGRISEDQPTFNVIAVHQSHKSKRKIRKFFP